jgi:predicted RNase H-like HicB family nuclease
MTGLGFEYNRNIYTLVLSKLAGDKDKVKIEITVNDDKSERGYNISCSLLTGVYSWIDLSGDTYKDVIDNISSTMKVLTLSTISKAFDIYNKTNDANMDLLDDMVMSKLGDNFVVTKSSFKEYIINTLEETINKLKN